MTHSSATRVPAQTCWLPRYSATVPGHSPGVASTPPTILSELKSDSSATDWVQAKLDTAARTATTNVEPMSCFISLLLSSGRSSYAGFGSEGEITSVSTWKIVGLVGDVGRQAQVPPYAPRSRPGA